MPCTKPHRGEARNVILRVGAGQAHRHIQVGTDTVVGVAAAGVALVVVMAVVDVVVALVVVGT